MSHSNPLSILPWPAIQLISLVAFANVAAWALAAALLHQHPSLLAAGVLAYTLGLRHALDADHIGAVDVATRRMLAAGRRPVAVGTFFSLGHSAVVLATCVAVSATAGALRVRFEAFQRVGAVVGSAVSAGFLLLLGAANGCVLWRLVVELRADLRLPERAAAAASRPGDIRGGGENENGAETAGQAPGFVTTSFRRLFALVDRPWKMFPLGILFGLGFDTSTEIAVLGIASVQAERGTCIWLILIFPVLFTAGMCLLDTADGALMLALYTSDVFARDALSMLYYSVVLTAMTVLVSVLVGLVQLLSLVQKVAAPEGRFWDGVGAIGDHYDVVGGCICGVFLAVGLGSVLVYQPWRRRMARGDGHDVTRQRNNADISDRC